MQDHPAHSSSVHEHESSQYMCCDRPSMAANSGRRSRHAWRVAPYSGGLADRFRTAARPQWYDEGATPRGRIPRRHATSHETGVLITFNTRAISWRVRRWAQAATARPGTGELAEQGGWAAPPDQPGAFRGRFAGTRPKCSTRILPDGIRHVFVESAALPCITPASMPTARIHHPATQSLPAHAGPASLPTPAMHSLCPLEGLASGLTARGLDHAAWLARAQQGSVGFHGLGRGPLVLGHPGVTGALVMESRLGPAPK